MIQIANAEADLATANDRKSAGGRRTKRDEQRDQTRARILKSALKHFSENGFAGSSLRDISADAGVTHAVIRLHFESKENLWKEAINHLFAHQEEEVGGLGTVASGSLTRDGFISIVRNYVRYCACNPDYMRIMIHETIRDSDRLRWVVENHLGPIHQRVRNLFTEAIKAGIVADKPVESLLYIWISASQMIFALRNEAELIHGIDVLDHAFVEHHADTIVSMLVEDP